MQQPLKPLNKRLLLELEKRQAGGNLRKLPPTSEGTDFSTNDYLGLARNKELHKNIGLAFQKYSEENLLLNGSTGSRLLSGNLTLAEEVENELAEWLQAEAVLLFPTGFQANLSLISCLPKKNDLIVYDELIHASMREGYRLAICPHHSYKHNDISHLEKRLAQARENHQTEAIFVLAESVYSMDGDQAPLPDLVKTCDQYHAQLLWDEAHSTGLFTPSGNGLACHFGLTENIFARVYTFGKAPGIHGACVAGPQLLKDYLINFSRGFIYSTALPPHHLISIRETIRFLQNNPALQAQLNASIWFFKEEVRKESLENSFIESSSAIQSILIPGNETCKVVAGTLQQMGFDVRPVLSPTVAVGKERLRIILHAFNTEEEIGQLVKELKKCLKAQ